MTEFELITKDKKSGKAAFLLKKSTPALANAIRRASIELVPTFAVDTVEISKNSGALYDEMIAHRIGLVPLTTDLKSYALPKEGETHEEFDPRYMVKLSLKAKGPGYVYAEQLESQDKKVAPAYPKMIIAKLLKGQELELVATAKLGRGSEHAKHSPGLVWYTYQATAKVHSGHVDMEKFKTKYPPLAFVNGKLDAKAIEEHHLFDACDGINKDIVDVQYDPTSFLFHVEPWGQLSAKDILTSAITELSESLADLGEKLTK